MANFDQTIVNLQDVSVTFESSGKPLHAVDNVSLQINRGDIYGIIGYSGAGKSTLVRTINLLQNRRMAKSLSVAKTCRNFPIRN